MENILNSALHGSRFEKILYGLHFFSVSREGGVGEVAKYLGVPISHKDTPVRKGMREMRGTKVRGRLSCP